MLFKGSHTVGFGRCPRFNLETSMSKPNCGGAMTIKLQRDCPRVGNYDGKTNPCAK